MPLPAILFVLIFGLFVQCSMAVRAVSSAVRAVMTECADPFLCSFHQADSIFLFADPIFHLSDRIFHVSDRIFHVSRPIFLFADPIFHLLDQIFHVSDRIFHVSDRIFHVSRPFFHLTDRIFHLTRPIFHTTNAIFHVSRPIFRMIDAIFHVSRPIFRTIDQILHLGVSNELCRFIGQSQLPLIKRGLFRARKIFPHLSGAEPISYSMPCYDDDGNELNPDLVPKPALCTMCMNDDDPHEEILCTLTRFDYREGEEFPATAGEQCYSFESKWGDDGNPKPPRPPSPGWQARPAPPWVTSSGEDAGASGTCITPNEKRLSRKMCVQRIFTNL